MSEAPMLILVAGVSRSGSTAVDFMLANRPDGFSLGEVYAWYRPFRPHHLDPDCSCGRQVRECPVWVAIGRPRVRHLHRHVADATGATVVVDSSKNLAWIRDAHRWARADGMDVRVVLTSRRPRDVALSYWKRGALDWGPNLDRYLDQLDDLGLPWHRLDFDALIDEPRATLDALHSDLGLETMAGQEQFWDGEFHAMFGSGGTRGQVGSISALSRPEPPEAFTAYWEDLPIHVREHHEARHAALMADRSPADAGKPSRRSLNWSLRQRLVGFRQSRRLQRPPSQTVTCNE